MDWRDRPHLEASATRIVLVTDPLQPVSFCDERFDAVVEWRFVCPGRKKHEKHACTWKTGRGVGWNVWITTMGLLAAGLAWRMMGGWCSWNRAPENPDRRCCWCWHSLCLCLRQSLPSWVRRCGCNNRIRFLWLVEKHSTAQSLLTLRSHGSKPGGLSARLRRFFSGFAF